MAKEKYFIHAGPRRMHTGITGNLDKTSKTPLGKQMEVNIPVGGYFIPAISMAWGRRVISKEKGKITERNGQPIEATDPDYRGEIEFLKWGDAKGLRILTQYLPSCGSLDKIYQEKRLNVYATSDDITIGLDQGQNDISYDSDEVKIEYLKICSTNKNSISKDPKITGHSFAEIKAGDMQPEEISAMKQRGIAVGIVNAIDGKPGNLKSLFFILGGISTMPAVQDVKNESQIYPEVLKYANSNFNEFMLKLSDHKKKMSDLFEKATEFQVLDTTTNGELSLVIQSKKTNILSGVEGVKGAEIKEWMLENITNPEVYQAFQTLDAEVAKLK